MGYIEKLLYVRLGALLLMGALSATTTGLAGKSLKQLTDKKNQVKDIGVSYGFPNATVHAGNIVAALACTCTAAAIGFIVAVYSEWHLHRERKKGYAPWGARFLNEALLVLVALFMLGGSIASTILVMHHSAVVTGVPPAVQELAMKAFNLSVRYRDYFCYYAMALSWVTFGVYVIVTALVIAAGLYYRKEAAQHRREQAEEKPTGAHIEAEA